ncbi:hypothetical protein ACFOLG_02870 [Vogesella facilis]|uniref:Uncharacterized protein n=1 Tax=Vogesella facilis TaxID=1655232 RepID=A0ABV7REN3_9NEIS
MNYIADLYWLASLAQASYANLNDAVGLDASALALKLQSDIKGASLFANSQAEMFSAEWEVLNHQQDMTDTLASRRVP